MLYFGASLQPNLLAFFYRLAGPEIALAVVVLPNKRTWCVILTAQAGEIQTAVWVDDLLLLPAAGCRPPSEIIEHLMVALADFRDGDTIAAIVNGPPFPFMAWTGTSMHLALHWIATTLVTVYCDDRPAIESSSFDAHETGLRTKPRPERESHTAGDLAPARAAATGVRA